MAKNYGLAGYDPNAFSARQIMDGIAGPQANPANGALWAISKNRPNAEFDNGAAAYGALFDKWGAVDKNDEAAVTALYNESRDAMGLNEATRWNHPTTAYTDRSGMMYANTTPGHWGGGKAPVHAGGSAGAGGGAGSGATGAQGVLAQAAQAAGNQSAGQWSSEVDAIRQSAGPMQGAASWTPDENSLVSRQLQGLLASDSPYMQQARTRAAQLANSHGLLNSSLALTAGESAAIEAARPIAEADARTHADAGRFNAEQSNLFARDSNMFGRDAAMERYRGMLGREEQDRSLAFERERLSADTSYRNADLAQRGRQMDADQAYRMSDLGLRRDEITANNAHRASDLDLRRDSLDADREHRAGDLAVRREDMALRREELETRAAQGDRDARQQLSADIARIRSAALDAHFRLESDPNMSADAKREAILAISDKATNDIRELVQFSGLELPDSWPDWLSRLTPHTPDEGDDDEDGGNGGNGRSPGGRGTDTAWDSWGA